jgi:hypothetical protein
MIDRHMKFNFRTQKGTVAMAAGDRPAVPRGTDLGRRLPRGGRYFVASTLAMG